MKAFAVCSLKGGVGKTSVVLGLASAALNRGLRTLVIDLDPQGDATMALDVENRPDRPDAASVLGGQVPAVDALQPSGWDEDEDLLDVLPGSMRSAAFDQPGLDGMDLGLLARAIAPLDDYDIVLIDCPPSLGGLTRLALAAAERAIVVTEPGLFAVAAAERALRAIHEVNALGPDVQPLGVVVNRVRSHTREHSFRVSELSDMFGPLVLQPVLPERSAIQQAQGALRPIHSWPGASATELSHRLDALLARALRAPSVHRTDAITQLPAPLSGLSPTR